MQLNTHIRDSKLEEMIKSELSEKRITKYQFVQNLVKEHFENFQEPKKLDNFSMTGDFEQDVKRLDATGITTKEILQALKKMDANRRVKNTIKKGGAFHEENCILDLKSMLDYGRPNFHELKYHFDWWIMVGLLSNVLARRGHPMTLRVKELLNGFEKRGNAKGSTMRKSYERARK